MKKLKIKLVCKILLLILFITLIIFRFINYKSKYNISDNKIVGTIIDIDYEKIIIKGLEKVLIKCDNCKFNIGDEIEVIGKLTIPNTNTNFNTFNYKKYLLSQNINYIVYNPNIKMLNHNNKWYYSVKQEIINHIEKLPNSSYIKAFILADSSELDKESYQKNGISHLFAISGMHITFLTSLMLKILNKINKKEIINYIIISLILILYMFIVSYSVSVVRASLMFIFLFINKITKLKLKTYEILLLLMLILLAHNPFYIYSISFKYSFIISFYLIIFSNLINKQKNYFSKLFIVSLVATLASFPITINNYHSINFMSIVFNLIFVPLFSYIVFPIGLITIFIPKIVFIFDFVINIFNNLSNLCNKITILNLSFPNLNIFTLIIYYLIITFIFYKWKRKNILVLLVYFIFLYFINYFNFCDKIVIFDVGQGDSLLIQLKQDKGNILIDTGGLSSSDYNITNNILISYMQSIGIRKLDYLLLTHGDFDHMGEAINLVNNFKVEKVIFNCGEYNDLEKELIKVLNKKNIKYYSCIKELNIDKNKLYFLQTKEYDNENDNSNVIYTELNGYRFIFMGDAGIDKEKDILDKYNLNNIDVLKVGHHGSKTSSGKDFINEIKPKYSIISVGKNNRYGHPNKEVLKTLNNSKIYRTDQDGSIMFKIKNNKLKIETCSP